MLTKSDIKTIAQVIDKSLKPVKKDLTDLKKDLTGVKSDLTGVKSDLTGVKSDLTGVKSDLTGVKQDLKSVKETVEFSAQGVVDLLEWTQDIHDSIVKEKLPERVRKLEKILHTS